MPRNIDKLIINSAYEEPKNYWEYSVEKSEFVLKEGRRSAGYFVAGQGSNQFNDIGTFIPLPKINDIRKRVRSWRESNYPGITSVTRSLLEHWRDTNQRQYPFFFCQLDAIETLIWYTEAPDSEKVGVVLDQDNNEFFRICSKMATGTGKTIVMAMLIAWSVINKVTYPMDKRFSKNVFIVAPGLTVKSRLSVLFPTSEGNYYDLFGIVPNTLRDKFNIGQVQIANWQMLSWEDEEDLRKKRSVDKRGPLSDEAYVRKVLGPMSRTSNILVINDEAHHAWKRNPEIKVKMDKEDKEALQEATVWVSGLERIHKVCNILSCYDFSATPFAPSGKKNGEEAIFGWIISDFGLNDAIESGLVKTPRVVVRDNTLPNAKTLKSRLYHLYAEEEIKTDINRAKVEPSDPLPSLLLNAYTLLGADWKETYDNWKAAGSLVPPVMISVVNRTETAARIKYAFDTNQVSVPELCNPDYMIHIDSNVLKNEYGDFNLESIDSEDGLTKDQRAALLRLKVDTIGRLGKPGEQIRNVISVGMLSEGWDAKTVTHIMGLRAFGSQLLCEQVIGRGLRRTSYDVDPETGLFTPEYVNIFGIPFSYLPVESNATTDGKPPKPTTQIDSLSERSSLHIDVPNVIRIEHVNTQSLNMNLEDIPEIKIDTKDTTISADMSAIVDGKTYMKDLDNINLQSIDNQYRLQTLVMQIAGRTFDADPQWKKECTKYGILSQIILNVNKFIESDRLQFIPSSMNKPGSVERRVAIMLNISTIVQHIRKYIELKNTDHLDIVLDTSHKIISTEDVSTWYTTKRCEVTTKSQISHCVFDSGFEALDMWKLERNNHVVSYVKNDHFGFEITYQLRGFHKYRPDFIIQLDDGSKLIYETKGIMDEWAITKFEALEEWVQAVNTNGQFGKWHCAITDSMNDLDSTIDYFIENPDVSSYKPKSASVPKLESFFKTVTQLIPTVSQPSGGYVPLALLKETSYDDQITPMPSDGENIHPTSMGMITEWLARSYFDDPTNVLVSVISGARSLNEEEKALKIIRKIKGMDDDSIDAAFQLVRYEAYFRSGKLIETPIEKPDSKTKDNIRIFTQRIIDFVKKQPQPYRFGKELFFFQGAISTGEADFITKDTIWDFKLSVSGPTTNHTLQVLLYYLMLDRSNVKNIDSIDGLGIFNARLNKSWRLEVKDISERAIEEVKELVMKQ